MQGAFLLCLCGCCLFCVYKCFGGHIRGCWKNCREGRKVEVVEKVVEVETVTYVDRVEREVIQKAPETNINVEPQQMHYPGLDK